MPTARCAHACEEAARARGAQVFFPEIAFCTDNGAMIALVGALRLAQAPVADGSFVVRPRWDLASLTNVGAVAAT